MATIYICPVCGCGDDSVYMISPQALIRLNKELKIDNVVTDAVNQVYNNRAVTPKTQTALMMGFYGPLKEAVNEGFGKPLAKVEYNSPNYELLKNLQTNTAVFAAFKGHAFTKDLVALLKDENGNLRPKPDFLNHATALDTTYRKDWLDTEYDTAARSARMAAIWAKAQKTAKLYPNLKYMPSRAAHQRKDHQRYYGIIRPINDVFWVGKYPPNGYKCQCGAEPTDEEATDVPHNLPEPDKGFDFNCGITGQVFDLKNSGYIKKVPPNEQPALIKQAQTIVNNEAAQTAPLQPLYTAKNGNQVVAHPIALQNTDFKQVLDTARQLANYKEGPKKIEILPTLNNEELRKQLLPAGVKGATNPDYLFNGTKVADLKEVNKNTRSAVQGAVSSCHKQCDNIVLKVNDNNDITSEDLHQYVKGQVSDKSYTDFDEIYIQYRGVFYKTTRKEVVEGNWPVPKSKTH